MGFGSDIEYFVQAWQIGCGRDGPSIRTTNTLAAVDTLRRTGQFSRDLADRISRSYTFLRRLVDALRAVRGNAKDLNAPPAHSREFRYLAHRLSMQWPDQLSDAIAECMETSQHLWEECPPPA